MLTIPKHRKVLFTLLREIYSSEIASYLGFKGGTMLYFFHKLNRFSVDLDFDLLDTTKEEMVSQKLRTTLLRQGNINDEMNKHNTWFFLLNYEGGEQNIKIEISKRDVSLNQYETKNFYGIDVRVLALKDAFSHKIVALTEREGGANRDFYDVWFLLSQGVGINEEIIQSRTGLSALDQLKSVRKYTEKRLAPQNILEGIGELVDEKQKVWLKEKFKDELLSLLDFTRDELRKVESHKVRKVGK